ncbi:hypothetical protein [Paenarthrobacter ureafaciens]|uniref:hypothetical protein n=1 Tax=Paenarthrobacter ureafaciens TaxID=37931 RepID=UPI001FB2D24A|nr:hypothetical protein [Paenarthrobacter ureafaciens]UOD80336.1 hypothetical protein MQZ73_14605 [Paenarthrobacter ureafaciens]WNZ02989.1 hypothetical protein PVT25_15245 [Paenarthrobacter ureafaciens]
MSVLEEPTDEYTMRHAANELGRMAREMQLNLTPEQVERINFAYQQLHRGANTLHTAQTDVEAKIREGKATAFRKIAQDLGWLGAQGNTVNPDTAWAGISTCRDILRKEADRIEHEA